MTVKRQAPPDTWDVGERYESYVGRWSLPVARELLRWLGVPPGARWLDVGCGTGTLAAAVLEEAAPRSVAGVDRSRGFVAHARARLAGAPVAFQIGDAQALPVAGDAFDAVVSGLVLNFVPEPARSGARRCVRPSGPRSRSRATARSRSRPEPGPCAARRRAAPRHNGG